MALLPVEVDISLTSLTFAHMFETAEDTKLSITLNGNVDVLVRQTFDGVLFDYLNGFFACSQRELVTLRAVCRQSKRHLTGHLDRTCSLVAEGVFRLVLGEAIHVCHLDTIVVFTCSQMAERISHVQFYPRISNIHDGRRRRRDERGLHGYALRVLNADIQFVTCHSLNHTVRHRVVLGFSCRNFPYTHRYTTGRTVERLTGIQFHCFCTFVSNSHLNISGL